MSILVDKASGYGIVLFLDVLGARTRNLEESVVLIEKIDRIVERMKRSSTYYAELAEKLIKTADADAKDFQLPELRHVTFGDSIVVTWAINDHVYSVRALLAVGLMAGEVVMDALHDEGLLLRGALSIGEFVQRSETILGPALTDAFEWHDKMGCIGVVATPKCGFSISRIRMQFPNPGAVDMAFSSQVVPTKDGDLELWIASWPFHGLFRPRNNQNENDLADRILEIFSTCSVPHGAENKYWNSLAYFDSYRREIFPKLKPIVEKFDERKT